MTMVTVSAVSGDVFASLTSSSLKNAVFCAMNVVTVTTPPVVGVGVGVGVPVGVGVGVGVRVGVGVGVGVWLGVGVGVDPSRPKKWMVFDSWIGMLCETPCSLVASTSTTPALFWYVVWVKPAWGLSVVVGVWLTPSTFVHCLISSPKLWKFSVWSAVPCQSCMRGLVPVKPGSALRTRSPHCCAVIVIWPVEQVVLKLAVPAKQPNGTPA